MKTSIFKRIAAAVTAAAFATGTLSVQAADTFVYGNEQTEITLWSGAVADDFAGGKGSQNDPYQIATAEQLALLADIANNGDDLSGKYFLLTEDIALNGDLSENEYAPVAYWTPVSEFGGTFDGGGHTISGVYLDPNESYSCGGVFGTVTGTITDLGITDSVIEFDTLLQCCKYQRSELCKPHMQRCELWRDIGYLLLCRYFQYILK